MRLWRISPSSSRLGLFEIQPYVYDHDLRDWREERARLLASTWLGAEALVPAGLVKLSISEAGAWFGPRELGGATPAREMASLRVRTIGTVAA